MIDWNNLEPLPRKRREGADRERLAKASFVKGAAKHKGRPHSHAWQRRQAAQQARERAEEAQAATLAKHRRYIDLVRAYWRGEIDEHPA